MHWIIKPTIYIWNHKLAIVFYNDLLSLFTRQLYAAIEFERLVSCGQTTFDITLSKEMWEMVVFVAFK